VAQFTTKKVASQAWAANTAQTAIAPVLNYTFPKSQYVYLTAETDNSTTSLTFSPPGKIF